MVSKLTVALISILIGITAVTLYQQDEWKMLTSKGEEESRNGQYDQAKTNFTAALMLVDKPGGDQSKLIESLRNLASLNHHPSQRAYAESLLRRALVVAETDAKASTYKPLLLWELAWLLDWQQRHAECRIARQKALKIWLSSPGPYPPEARICMNTVAKDCAAIGQYSEAERIYQQSMSNRKVNRLCTYTGPHQDTADIYNMAELELSRKNYSSAAEYFKQLGTIGTREAGIALQRIHPELQRAADMYCRAGNYKAAEELYIHALKALENDKSSEHKSEFSCLYSLALLYDVEGKFEIAKPLYKYCFARCKEIDNKYPCYLPEEFSTVIEFLNDTHQTAKEEELVSHNLQLCEDVLGSTHILTTMYLGLRAYQYEEQGRLVQCQQIRERILNNSQKNYGPNSGRACNSLYLLGQLHLRARNLSEAQRYLEQALELDKRGGREFFDGTYIRAALAALYNKQKRPEKVPPLLADTLKNQLHIITVQEEEFGDNSPHLSIELQSCAETYYLVGKYPQAFGLIKRTASLQLSDPSLPPEELVEALTYNAKLLRKMNYSAEAKELEFKAKKVIEQLASKRKLSLSNRLAPNVPKWLMSKAVQNCSTGILCPKNRPTPS